MSGVEQPGAVATRVVAIDGPSGVGKSTVARLLARRLGVAYLDSGALYRAVALKVLRSGIDPDDAEAVERVLAATRVEVVLSPGEPGVVRLDGEAVDDALRTPAVTAAASRVAPLPAVRQRLTAIQRDAVPARGAVIEGRDVGSVVFPCTPHKFFLDARLEVRGARRLEDPRERVTGPSGLGRVVAAIEERDRRDRERAHSPLRRDDTYRVIDTSDLSAEEVATRIEREIERAGGLR